LLLLLLLLLLLSYQVSAVVLGFQSRATSFKQSVSISSSFEVQTELQPQQLLFLGGSCQAA
jgi:hypothetical protein